jgi:hypothetical protein
MARTRLLDARTSLRRYAAEEFAPDHGGGLLSRREAIRRLGLLGLSVASVSALTVAYGNERAAQTSLSGADAFVDFRTKPDGEPPAELDTGQPVDYVQDAWKPTRKPRIVGGELVPGTLPESGAFANYYQARLDGECRAFGTTWTVDSSDGSSTSGVMCLAAWAGVYESGTGRAVPKTPGHIVIDTITSEWQWWVSDGGGARADHLKAVKVGTFIPPASDGVAVWETAVYLDDSGLGYLYLPGNDAGTGTRYVTLSNAEVATGLAAVGLPATTIEATHAGGNVVMVEHYANSAAGTARYPRFLTMWAKTRPPSRAFDGPPS